MGVDATFYVVYGIKIDWDDDVYQIYNSKFEQIEKDKNFNIICDNMCGKYIILGKILASFDAYEVDSEFKIIDVENSLGWLKEQLFTGLNKYFDEDLVEKIITENQCELFAFIHYS